MANIFTVSVLLPDKPGETGESFETLARGWGNVIKLEHNQFVSTNRNAAVELSITFGVFWYRSQEADYQGAGKAGYKPKIVRT